MVSDRLVRTRLALGREVKRFCKYSTFESVLWRWCVLLLCVFCIFHQPMRNTTHKKPSNVNGKQKTPCKEFWSYIVLVCCLMNSSAVQGLPYLRVVYASNRSVCSTPYRKILRQHPHSAHWAKQQSDTYFRRVKRTPRNSDAQRRQTPFRRPSLQHYSSAPDANFTYRPQERKPLQTTASVFKMNLTLQPAGVLWNEQTHASSL